MSNQNFKPNFETWYKRKSVTKEEFSLVLLGVEPELYKKSRNLSSMFELNAGVSNKEPTPEDASFYWAYSEYLRSLLPSVTFGYAYNAFMRLEWNGNKDDFIKEAYRHRANIHPDMYAFLDSIKKKPFIKTLEHFKDHNKYKAKLEHWKGSDVQGEDAALSLLLGLEPKSFLELLALEHRQETEKRSTDGLAAFSGFSPEEKWLFLEYNHFLKEEFPRMDWPIVRIRQACKKARALQLWTGDLFTYAQKLFDNGFVFRPETFDALERLGLRPTYAADSWAIGFYKRYLRQGTWNLKDAACLYLGDDPREGRGFESLGNASLYGSGAGLALETAETIAEYDENDNFIPPPDRTLKDMSKYLHSNIPHFPDSDLEDFVRGHIDAGNLVAARDEGRGKLYFKPTTIVEFFKNYLPRTYRSEALFEVLKESSSPPRTNSISTQKHPASHEEIVSHLVAYSKDNNNRLPSRDGYWEAIQKAFPNRITWKAYLHAHASIRGDAEKYGIAAPGVGRKRKSV